MTVHAVLAGAYLSIAHSTLTHASQDGGSTAVCGGVRADSLCEDPLPGEPTCKTCLRRFQRARRYR